MNKTHYIIAMMIPAALYSIMQLVVAYISDQTDLEVVCTVAAIYTDDSQLVFAVGGCLLNMIVIVVYVLMWIIVRKKASASSAKKLIKTLIIIVTCVVFGYYATMLVFLVIVVLDLDPVSSFYGIMGGGMFVNASVSCNFFVLYWLCAEYKVVFRRQLRLSTATVTEVAKVKTSCNPSRRQNSSRG